MPFCKGMRFVHSLSGDSHRTPNLNSKCRMVLVLNFTLYMPKALIQHSPACNAGLLKGINVHSAGMIQEFEASLQLAILFELSYLGFHPRLG